MGSDRVPAFIGLPGRIIAATGLAVVMAAVAVTPLQDAVANGDTRTLSFVHTHTEETLTTTFKRDGRLVPGELEKLNHFLRDWRTDDVTRMDPQLFDIVWEVYREVGATEPIHVVSAYRSPRTNAMLRSRSRGVAQFSHHMGGRALDFTIPGASTTDIRAAGIRLQRGGVGFYPGSNFVHLDTGSVRAWPRMSRDQLARLFPDGRTVHLPADGRPMPGYAQALADLARRGGTIPRQSIEVARESGVKFDDSGRVIVEAPGRNFLATLFGSREEEEEDSAAANAAMAQAPARTRLGGGERVAAATPAPAPPAPVPTPQPAAQQAAAPAAPPPLPTPRPAAAPVAGPVLASLAPVPVPVPRPGERAAVAVEVAPARGPALASVPPSAPTASAALASVVVPAPPSLTRGAAPSAPAATAALPAAIAGRPPAQGQPSAGQPPLATGPVLAYAPTTPSGPTGSLLQRQASPMVPSAVAAQSPAVAAAPKGERVMGSGARTVGDPWLRLLVLNSRDVARGMPTTVFARPEGQNLPGLMVKPSVVVPTSFARVDVVGPEPVRFAGDAVAFPTVVRFAASPQRTAAVAR